MSSDKPQKVIALQGKTQYVTEALNRSTFAPGLYKMRTVRVGNGFAPGLEPVEISNDEPLEIDDSVKDIIKEFGDFFDRRDTFKKMGFSHKRGYLLHGPPGCGKSSTLRLLEKRFVDKYKGLVLFWDNGSAIDAYYDFLRDEERDRPILVVCEDIDSYLERFEERILEFLDGQRGLDNFVLVATTNSLSKIPSRIKDRPSRIDRLLEIGKPNEKTRYQYLFKITNGDAEKSETLARMTNGMSIAQLKEVVVATVCLGQPLDLVLKRVSKADMSIAGAGEDDDSYGDEPTFLSKDRKGIY